MICNECETVAHCTKYGCISERIGKPKPTAQPAPVQEPVGYWLIGTDHVEFDKHEYHNGPEWEAIYTTPPAAQRQWVGLSEEEILKLAYPIRWQEVDDFEADKAVNFAQTIEAKLKEKNT